MCNNERKDFEYKMERKIIIGVGLCMALVLVAGLFVGCKKKGKPEATIETGPKPEVAVESIGSVNVAPEGFAMASSCKNSEGYSNLNLNDGDPDTAFSSAWGRNWAENKEYYVYTDLTKVLPVDKVVLRPAKGEEKALPLAFEILVSDDGKEYTTVNEYETDPSADYSKDGFAVELEGIEARFVKLVTKKLHNGGEKGYYFALGELEIYSQATNHENIVMNRDDIVLHLEPANTQVLEIVRYRNDSYKPDEKATLKFYSDDLDVATVNIDGLVVPKAYGETDVYVYDGKNITKCHVAVTDTSKEHFRTSAFYHSSYVELSAMHKVFDYFAQAGLEYIEGTRAYDMNGNNVGLYSIFLCKERGINYSVCDVKNGAALLKMSDEEIINVVKKYENRAGCSGIYLQDEPFDDSFTRYAEVFKTITDYNPHVTPHLNLLSLIGFAGTAEYWTEVGAITGGADRTKFLSFDYYPYKADNTTFDRTLLDMLNRMRKTALKYNAATGYYIQVADQTDVLRPTTDNEILYNASLGVAYGMKNYKYFVAVTPLSKKETYVEGILNKDFEPSSMYQGVKAANAYIHSIGKTLGNSDALEVYHSTRTVGNETFPENFALTPADNSDIILTLYESLDNTKQQHIVVTNKRYAAELPTEIALKVAPEIASLAIVQDGKETPLEIPSDRIINLSIDPGACCVLKLPQGHDATVQLAPAPSENLALNSTAYVSSSQAGFAVNKYIASRYLTDGNKAMGGWLSAEHDKDAFAMIDLGEVKNVNKVILYPSMSFDPSFAPKAYTIYVSEDGKNFTKADQEKKASFTNDPYKGVTTKFSDVKARYVKIQIDTGKCGGFGEIEIFG